MVVDRWDERRSAYLAVAGEIEAKRSLLTSRTDLRSRQLAAAGLLRCRRLLMAGDLLREAALADAVGTAIRPLFECWLVAAWALFGGESVWDEMAEDYKFRVFQLDREADLKLPNISTWAGAQKGPSTLTVAERLAGLLANTEDPSPHTPVDQYNVFYRAESLRSAHGGLGATIGHLVDGGHHLGVVGERVEPDDAQGMLVWAGALLAVLAGWVFDAFGIARTHLDECAAPLAR